MEIPDGFDKRGRQKWAQKAGSVSIVNFKKEVIYSAKIFRKFGSYRTTSFTRAKNGFTDRSLQANDCKSLNIVQEDLDKTLHGGLLIGISLVNDILSLNLPPADFDLLDLQWYWFHRFQNSKGKSYEENISLRSLCKHFFDIDVQPDAQIHTADNDAIWTMTLFTDIFLQIKPTPMSRKNYEHSNYIKNYKG